MSLSPLGCPGNELLPSAGTLVMSLSHLQYDGDDLVFPEVPWGQASNFCNALAMRPPFLQYPGNGFPFLQSPGNEPLSSAVA